MGEVLLRNRIRYRILLLVGAIAMIGQVVTAALYVRHEDRTIFAQREFAMLKLTESITQGVYSVMLAGSADIAQEYADGLKKVPEVQEFRIMRRDGMEAFRDNKTILEVNNRRGEDAFIPRDRESTVRVMDNWDADLGRVLSRKEVVPVYSTDGNGNPTMTMLAPILNQDGCHKCHGKANAVRGVLRITMSLASGKEDISRARWRALAVLVLSITGTILLVGYLFGRIVVSPLERITRAMRRISDGDLKHRISVTSHDEIGHLATNFNRMTGRLNRTYLRLQRERNKLKTVIESTSEGLVVTNAAGEVVIVNAAASRFLDKTVETIVAGGFLELLDDPGLIRGCIEQAGSITVHYKKRTLQMHASTIRDGKDSVLGSVAMIRDVSAETQLEDDLRRLSVTDGLTGLFNRRFLDQTLNTEFRRAKRSHDMLSVVMIDVDHFKKFNDVYGHDQGDRVLQMVARCMREILRDYDFPCRYGGEEFAALLPGMNSAAAMDLAERLRVTVEATELEGVHVQISLGVATYPALAVDSGPALIEAADAALYRAKEGGRNRVCAAGSMPC